MGTIWLYIVTVWPGDPVIAGEYRTQVECLQMLSRGQPELERAMVSWVSGCVAVEHEEWTFVRAHR